MKRIATLFLVLLTVTCGGSPTKPTETGNVSGTWDGTYSSAQLGYGQASLSLVQNGSSISGTWNTTPDAGGGQSVGAGTLSGVNTTAGATGIFRLDMSPSNPRSCPFSATMTFYLVEQRMTGDWVTTNCTVTATGGLILRKR